jgi:glycine cleavage system H protein
MEQVNYKEFSFGNYTFRVPASGYFFNNRDCWARIVGDRAKVGAADFVQQNAGEVRSFDLPPVGVEYLASDDICTLVAAKTTIDIVSPVSGRLVAVNQELIENPGLMNEDPYERGWVVELELTDIDEDIELLMDCEQYYDIAKAKIERGPNRACPCTRQGALYRRPDAKG